MNVCLSLSVYLNLQTIDLKFLIEMSALIWIAFVAHNFPARER